jgi:voltage-gated potassium channel
MAFATPAGVAAILVALTLLLQCAGMAVLIHWVRTYLERGLHRFGVFRSAILMVQFTSVIIALHLLQILLWAGFYRWNGLPSWESAFYFSAASYSTVGAGDLLLPRMWRTLGPVESVTGVLMCGLSAAFLFAIVTRLVKREERFLPELVRPAGERASTQPQSNASRWTERRR